MTERKKLWKYGQTYALLYTSAVSFCIQEGIEEKLFEYLRKNGLPEPPTWEEEDAETT